MIVGRQLATIDDLMLAVESIVEQMKVLISAVDDLRCEVEWQARNRSSADYQAASEAPLAAELSESKADNADETTADSTLAVNRDDSLLTAAGRLRTYENVLQRAPRGFWRAEWDEAEEWDVVDLPVGRVFALSADLLEVILGVRPSHVVGQGCDCEEGTGAPYLVAWHSETEFMVRELSDDEARRLQALCLAAQAEYADQTTRQTAAQVQSQLGLF